MRRHQLLSALACVVLTAWLSPGAVGQTTPPPAPPPTPIAFQDALLKAANDLFSKANLEGAGSKITLVIDPLIDGATGAQSVATQSMERRITELVKESYPRFEVTRFSTAALGQSPVVLIGTFTAINNAGVADGARDAYRICLALADLGSKKIISKGVARALPESIDPTPVAFFKDSPVFVRDTATTSYIKSCQGTRPGDAMDAAYADRILAAALINDAMEAYNHKKYKDALDLYKSASRTPGGDQLRVLNGLYLANLKLNRRDAAADAFGQAVDLGLKSERLAVKFLFRAGSTQFVADRQESGQYAAWVSQIAKRIDKADTCLEIVGHTSATGIAAMNDRLSMLRAGYVMDLLDEAQKGVHRRMVATGVGSRELIVGTGKDDASDALDRRVELKTIKC